MRFLHPRLERKLGVFFLTYTWKELMRLKTSRMIGTIALLSCFICPVLETFDHWDPPIQTGNDTEFTIVILALCVGAAYLFARPLVNALRQSFADKQNFVLSTSMFFRSTSSSYSLLDDTGPPAAPLRI